jgi:membrane protein implicated in regulation of membrane protease activity
MTWELPLWPPLVATLFAVVAYIVLWLYGRRLDRELKEEKRPEAGE